MEIVRTEIQKHGPTAFTVTIEIADNRQVEVAGERILLTVDTSTEDDNPLLRELQGAALDRALSELQKQRLALKVWPNPAS